MVAILAGRGDEEAARLRRTLLDAMIPCALIGPEYGCAAAAHRVPFVLFAESAKDFAGSFRRTLSPKQILTAAPDGDIVSDVVRQLLSVYHIDMECHPAGEILCRDGFVWLGMCPMKLTRSEQRIVHLLAFCGGNWFDGDEIAAFCLQNGNADAAAVHICHINAQSERIDHVRVIECRRYSGYRIAPGKGE